MDKTETLFRGIVPISILKDLSKVGRRQMDGRPSHGFIIKLRGATEYCCGDTTCLLSAGQVLYVAKGASYFIREVEPGYSYVVNFSCEGHPVEPVRLLRFPNGYDITPLAERLYHDHRKQMGEYAVLSDLYGLLSKTVWEEPYVSPGERRLLAPAVAYLQTHLTDPELSLESLSRLAGVSEVYLRRVFKKQYGMAPAAFVTARRMALACDLLEQETCPVAEVALRSGYRDGLYFSRLFRKQTGMTPTEYRRQHRDALF